MSQNWRQEIDAGDYLGNRDKKLNVADRRPVIRRGSDLVGPGIGPSAVRITDYNDLLATYDGYYSSTPGAAHAPNNTDAFVGTVVMDGELGGKQVFTSLAPGGGEYSRIFLRGVSDPSSITWGAWVSAGGVPAGVTSPFAGAVAPSGYLLANGALVSRTAYANLFAAIGTAWGAGDGSTTFALPDMRDRSPVGASGTKAVGTAGGSATKTLTAANLPPHAHTIAHTHQPSADGYGFLITNPTQTANRANGTGFNATGGGATTQPSNPNSGNGPGTSDPIDVTNPYRAMNYIIKT